MPRRTINASSSSNSNRNETKNLSSSRPINNSGNSRHPSVNGVVKVKSSTRRTSTKDLAKSTVSSKRIEQRQSRRSPNVVTSTLLYLLRFGIMGVGISAIAGTILTVFDPTSLLAAYFNTPPAISIPEESTEPEVDTASPSPTATIALGKELTDLQAKLEKVAAQEKYAQVKPKAWFIDLDNGNYVSLGGTDPVSAASTIKIPVLVAFFEDLDAGKIHLDEMLTMDKGIITGGSGSMQYQTPGTKFSALETATKMIVISDNTATDMLIRRLGGKEALNERFRQWGLTNTVINNRLPDLEGTNTTSAEDLSKLLARVERGDLLTMRSRDRLLDIMQETRTRTLLPQGLEQDAVISHKTGDIGTILGDAGIIDIPTGKRYIGAVFANRSHNDPMGRAIIQDFSRTAYQHFKWYQPRPATKPPEPPQASEPSTPSQTPATAQ